MNRHPQHIAYRSELSQNISAHRIGIVAVIATLTILLNAAPASSQSFDMAVKTNMLYDAALVPNLGVEFHLGKGWSLGADAMYANWKSDRRHRYWCVSGVEANLRRYFRGKKQNKNGNLTGHHLGIYGQIASYDFEFGGPGYVGPTDDYTSEE